MKYTYYQNYQYTYFCNHHHGIIPQCINCHDIMIDIQNRVSFPHIYFETRDGH